MTGSRGAGSGWDAAAVTTLTRSGSIVVATDPETLYDLVSDVTRTGEWSPVCTSCWWDDPDVTGVGAWFTGRNELPERTWETRSKVIVADRGREFAFVVGGTYVRWAYTFASADGGTEVTESWEFLPEGIAMFRDKHGDNAQAEIDKRTAAAHDGIPRSLAAIRKIAEAG